MSWRGACERTAAPAASSCSCEQSHAAAHARSSLPAERPAGRRYGFGPITKRLAVEHGPHASLGDLGYTFPVMTRADLQLEAMQLSVEDRLELAAALWESLERQPAQPELPVWQRETLDARWADDDATPAGARPGKRSSRESFPGYQVACPRGLDGRTGK